MMFRLCAFLVRALVIAALFVGWGGIGQTPPLGPKIYIYLRPIKVVAGEIADLTWSSTNAKSCVASGAWSGEEQTSSKERVASAEPGRYTYLLTCSGDLGKITRSATLTVLPCPRCKVR